MMFSKKYSKNRLDMFYTLLNQHTIDNYLQKEYRLNPIPQNKNTKSTFSNLSTSSVLYRSSSIRQCQQFDKLATFERFTYNLPRRSFTWLFKSEICRQRSKFPLVLRPDQSISGSNHA